MENMLGQYEWKMKENKKQKHIASFKQNLINIKSQMTNRTEDEHMASRNTPVQHEQYITGTNMGSL